MRSTHAGTDAPLLGGSQWLPWGPPFAMRKVGRWKRNIGIQALRGLTTVAAQPGEIAVGTLKPSHMEFNALNAMYVEGVEDVNFYE